MKKERKPPTIFAPSTALYLNFVDFCLFVAIFVALFSPFPNKGEGKPAMRKHEGCH